MPTLFGKTGWTTSFVGFGGYRIRDCQNSAHVNQHELALKQALASGIDIIDTSPNYSDGSSECLIGRVLSELPMTEDKRALPRVVTKAGCIQGQALATCKTMTAKGAPFREILRYQDDFWHCISPEFLSWQINQSLKRLKLERINLLLLHNPEYFLRAESNLSEYYRRIENAFRHLESEAERGRIEFYGISSNTITPAQDSAESTSLQTLLEIADRIGPQNRFAAIECPLNLFESQAALDRDEQGRSVLRLAAENGLGVLTNRPLNVLSGRKLFRLANFPSHHGIDVEAALHAALAAVFDAESRMPSAATDNISWGSVIRENIDRLSDIVTWTETLESRIRPRFNQTIESFAPDPTLHDWSQEYRELVEKLFLSFSRFIEARSAAASRTLTADLHKLCPELKTSPTLSSKVLRIYRSIPGIGCILVGMRRPEYVLDILGAAPPIDPATAMALLDHFKLDTTTSRW